MEVAAFLFMPLIFMQIEGSIPSTAPLPCSRKIIPICHGLILNIPFSPMRTYRKQTRSCVHTHTQTGLQRHLQIHILAHERTHSRALI